MKRNLIALCGSAAIVCGMAQTVHAGLLVEDFGYDTGGNLAGENGGSGWGGAWGSGETPTSTIDVNPASNLSFSNGNGYAIAQTGTGLAFSANDSARRMINRPVATPLSGEVWFSYLYNTSDASAQGVGISFNSAGFGTDGAALAFRTVLDGNDVRFVVNGSTSNATISKTLAESETHLAVGKVVTGAAGTVDFSIWIDPADLNSLGTADFSRTDIAGLSMPSITRVGVTAEGNGTDPGQIDALRVSDTATAFGDVTAVPEPASLTIFGVGGLVMLRRRRSREVVI